MNREHATSRQPEAPTIHGRFDGGFGWIAHPGELMERASTALAEGGRVWLVDPVRAPGIEDAIASCGKVAAVLQTVPWHDRDVAWFATLYGVPIYVPRQQAAMSRRMLNSPVEAVDALVPDSPLRFVPAHGRGILRLWKEAAVWWPEQGVLVIGDALGAALYYIRPGERLAVHPIRRLSPPVELGALRPQRLFSGHGPGVIADAAAALDHALATARSELLPAWRHALRSGWWRMRRDVG